MPPDLSPESWTQIRNDYEHTDRPVDDICAEHGISSGTLRDRMRRWGWTRRRPPIPPDGPPPAPPPAPPVAATAAPVSFAPVLAAPVSFAPVSFAPVLAAPVADGAAPAAVAPADAAAPVETDGRAIELRLRSAVARVLPAIEATLATLATGSAQPRDMERAARVLAALTRTLSELNGLLRLHGAAGGGAFAPGEQNKDIATRRRELAAKLEAFVASQAGRADGGGKSQRES